MSKSKQSEDLPKNKKGGLNLNWAICRALNKLGIDAKIADVREFISENYGPAGKQAISNEGSLSTGLSAMRRKLREESSKVPPVPVNGVRPVVPSAAPRPDTVPFAGSSSAVFSQYVKTTLKPAWEIVQTALAAAFEEQSEENLNKLKQAIAEVEEGKKVFGDRLPIAIGLVE